jgi:single-strand DNA-binding protein
MHRKTTKGRQMPYEGTIVPNLNTSAITGNLTHDPEVWGEGDETFCLLRVAVNGSQWDEKRGKYVQKPNYFDVVVFGRQGEACGDYLSKGRPVAVEGRLDWHQYYSEKFGCDMSSVQIIARKVQFLGEHSGGSKRGRGRRGGRGRAATPQTQVIDIDNMPMEMFEGLADLVAQRIEEGR